MSEHASGKVRLQKFLSEAGVAARRVAEDLVLEGRVKINGRVVDGLPAFVDPQEDDVRVDGERVRAASRVYYLLNKPKGTVVSNYDPAGRKKVGDLLAGVVVRVFPVGRLEIDADGVLLMTNDGDLAGEADASAVRGGEGHSGGGEGAGLAGGPGQGAQGDVAERGADAERAGECDVLGERDDGHGDHDAGEQAPGDPADAVAAGVQGQETDVHPDRAADGAGDAGGGVPGADG